MEENLVNELNVYCDESRVENPDSSKMVIGALFLPRKEKYRVTKKLKSLLDKFNFQKELKWTKTDEQSLKVNKAVLDFFASESVLKFRCIVVDRTQVNYELFHDNDPELAFFKFYYLMLRPKLLDHNKYYIFLDRKPTRDRNRARALHSYLDSYILLHRQDCSIKHLQAYSSSENILIQLADYLTGLVAYSCNTKVLGSSTKSQVAKYMEVKLNRPLSKATKLSEEKFNVFIWKGKE